MELRRRLGELDWPGPVDTEDAWFADDTDRPVVEAVMRDADPDEAAAIGWALSEIDRLRAELDEALDRRSLLGLAESGDADARERLRQEAVARLEAANVTAATATWSDGFGPADEIGLALPCLALALPVKRTERLDDLVFDPSRRWYALHHRVAPRPMSRYERAVVTPLAVRDDAELALRRLAPRVRGGRSVAVYRQFHELASVELPDIDVGPIRDELSPGWVPFPVGAIARLCADGSDAGVGERLDELVETTGFLGFVGVHWKLVWIADDLDDAESWW